MSLTNVTVRWNLQDKLVEAHTVACAGVHELPPCDRCEFVVKMRCDNGSMLFSYHYFMFCVVPYPAFENAAFVSALVLMVAWLLALFLLLQVVAEEFFCPSLAILSHQLRMSEHVSGVTLVALGNAATNIYSSMLNPDSNIALPYSVLAGSALFSTSAVAGYIVLVRPFRLQPFQILRDMCFLLVSTGWLVLTVEDGFMCLYESVSFLLIYIMYIVTVIMGQLIQRKINHYFKIDEELPAQWGSLRAKSRYRMNKLTSLKRTAFLSFQDFHPGNESDASLSKASEESEEEKEASLTTAERIQARCLESPFIILLRLLIPVIHQGEDKDGWCKVLCVIQCLLYPSYIVFTIKVNNVNLFGVSLFVPATVLGVLMAAIVYMVTRFDEAPKHHKAFAVLGFVGAITGMRFFVDEIITVFDLFVTLLKVNVTTVGITLLSWGTNIGDVLANVAIARQGFQRMGFAACFGASIANMLLGISFAFITRNVTSDNFCSKLRPGMMGPVTSTFLLINISHSLLYILVTDFQARRSYGAFLLLMYTQFLIFCLLCEVDYTHSWGFKVITHANQST